MFFSPSLSIIPLALQLHISPLCQFYLFFSHTDEEFQLIQICKSSVHIWLFPLCPLSHNALCTISSPSLFIKDTHFFSLPKALSCATHSFLVWLGRLTRLTGVCRSGSPPLLSAGNLLVMKVSQLHTDLPVSIPSLDPLSPWLAPSLLL